MKRTLQFKNFYIYNDDISGALFTLSLRTHSQFPFLPVRFKKYEIFRIIKKQLIY